APDPAAWRWQPAPAWYRGQACRYSRTLAKPLFFDGGLLHVIQIRKVLLQVSVPFPLNPPLLRPATRGSTLAIPAVKRVDDIHPGGDLAEGRKPLAIEPRVVGEVDEHLAGAGIGTGGCKCDEAAFVALSHRVILDGRIAPWRRHSRIAVDAE